MVETRKTGLSTTLKVLRLESWSKNALGGEEDSKITKRKEERPPEKPGTCAQ